ncbi:hypothetical protein M758_12G144800 [Ceratodon purpureus]|nr:hypothetical protein M758_12G144800 [Ceratodon purpureus]
MPQTCNIYPTGHTRLNVIVTPDLCAVNNNKRITDACVCTVDSQVDRIIFMFSNEVQKLIKPNKIWNSATKRSTR